MASKMDISEKKVITPEFQVSFPAVFTPKGFQGQEPKYSVVMLFDKKTDLSSLKKAAFNAAVEKWGPKEKHPKGMRLPFRDGDEKADTQGYQGKIFVTVSSKTQPGLVDQKRQAILDASQFYAGCYARAELIAFAYDQMGNRGVSFALQNIQKLRDGKPFGGRRPAEDVFDEVADTSDDQSSYADTDDELGF